MTTMGLLLVATPSNWSRNSVLRRRLASCSPAERSDKMLSISSAAVSSAACTQAAAGALVTAGHGMGSKVYSKACSSSWHEPSTRRLQQPSRPATAQAAGVLAVSSQCSLMGFVHMQGAQNAAPTPT